MHVAQEKPPVSIGATVTEVELMCFDLFIKLLLLFIYLFVIQLT